jgi:glycosyltransferase involved in cell wall biosynthesis
MGWRYYRDYAAWSREVPALVRRVVKSVGPCRVHHVTLGSFRFLPRYDQCGVPYSLGPLAGGEVMPLRLLGSARLPPGALISEWLRPALNRACTLVPGMRKVVRNSRLVLATSAESERIVRLMGARRTAVVFPDRVPPDLDPAAATDARRRADELRREVRLVWSGRAVWWKAGHVAVELLRRLCARGVDARMEMFTYGPALPEWQRQIAAAGLTERCAVSGFVTHRELHRTLGGAHAFVYPTFHDSSCPALLEAYAMGLPSLSVGLGGPSVVATPATGFNVRPDNLNQWLEDAVEWVSGWQANPETWLAASRAAQRRAAEFDETYLDRLVTRWLIAPDATSQAAAWPLLKPEERA